MELEELQKQILDLKVEVENYKKSLSEKEQEIQKITNDNIELIDNYKKENKELREHNNYLFRKVTFEEKPSEEIEDGKSLENLINEIKEEI